jgi:hypothetical protein
MQNLIHSSIFISDLTFPFILLILSTIFYIKERTLQRLTLCIGLFLFSFFSPIIVHQKMQISGNLISTRAFRGILPFFAGDIIFNIGKILIVIGFTLAIFKSNYKK